jgi:hypothetical protein
MSHTPGPWTLEFWGDREIDVYSGEDTLVCSLRGGSTHPDDDSDADANLIAAAPDLLAALREVADGCERRLRKGKDQGDLDTLRVCRSAIAKAEGGE